MGVDCPADVDQSLMTDGCRRVAPLIKAAPLRANGEGAWLLRLRGQITSTLRVRRGDYRLADDLLDLCLGEGGLGVFDFGAARAAPSAFAAGQVKRHSRPEEG
jgi:hypothetical protein